MISSNAEDCDALLNCFQVEHCISIAESAKEAISFLEEYRPDIILLDEGIDGLNPDELNHKMKSLNYPELIPVILLRNHNQMIPSSGGYCTGISDFITKPLNLKELRTRLQLHFARSDRQNLYLQKYTEQQDLLNVMCHDLSNTFTSILAFSQCFNGLSGKNLNSLDNLRASAQNGCDIIRLVRTFCETQEHGLHLSSINLQESLERSLLILQPQFSTKNIKINLNIQPGVSILAEETSLTNSVFNNLISNAIKFSHANTSIDIQQESDGEMILVRIKDQGVGIPDSIVHDVFDFEKNRSRCGTRGEKGTGFGMPLTMRFMRHYRGSINLSSRCLTDPLSDHGTTVELKFRKAV